MADDTLLEGDAATHPAQQKAITTSTWAAGSLVTAAEATVHFGQGHLVVGGPAIVAVKRLLLLMASQIFGR